MTAYQDQLFIRRELLCRLLREHLARRVKENRTVPFRKCSGLFPDIAHGSIDWLGFQYHPRPTAARCIIHMAVLVRRVVAEVRVLYVQYAALCRTANDARTEHAREHLGKERHKINSHRNSLSSLQCFSL